MATAGNWGSSDWGKTIWGYKTAAALGVFGLLATAGVAPAGAQTFTTLHSFIGLDGVYAYSDLIRGADGSLYGTTLGGGANGIGTVFKIDPTSGIETVLHSFATEDDGYSPDGALVQDPAGNLYGTTRYGRSSGSYTNGTVFKVDSSGNETLLYSFTGGKDGSGPTSVLVRDAGSGNLYGTTIQGGDFGAGTVFKIDPTSGNETILHSFAGGIGDGSYPWAGLVRDKAGNLYGLTQEGGAYNKGTIFEVDANGTETVLHSFAGGINDGAEPYLGSLIQDAAGTLYGTTPIGGAHGNGIVFKFNPISRTETVLYNFAGSDGSDPSARLLRDAAGNLYGVTALGGASGNGTVFKLDTNGIESVLHSFTGNAQTADGSSPYGGLIQDASGALYGTTVNGGANGDGTVFKLTTTTPFQAFSARLEITAGPPSGYQLNATFTQAHSAPAIAPLTQGITLSIGPSYTLTLPGSAFTQTKQGSYVYQSSSTQVRITQTGVDARTGAISWQVQVEAKGVNLTGLRSPSVTLTLGINTGTTTP